MQEFEVWTEEVHTTIYLVEATSDEAAEAIIYRQEDNPAITASKTITHSWELWQTRPLTDGMEVFLTCHDDNAAEAMAREANAGRGDD